MTIYKCKKCLKEFNRKCNYDYHTLHKKKACNDTTNIKILPDDNNEQTHKYDNEY